MDRVTKVVAKIIEYFGLISAAMFMWASANMEGASSRFVMSIMAMMLALLPLYGIHLYDKAADRKALKSVQINNE